MQIFWPILILFIAGAFAPVLTRLNERLAHFTLSLTALFSLLLVTFWFDDVQRGASVAHVPWLPALDVNLTFLLDGLSFLFALLITGIGALIVIYAGAYLRGHHHLGRLYLFLFIFMGAMLGLVLSDNLISMFVFWELTSISSYFLIGFNHNGKSSRDAALQALLVTGAGGLILLFGLVLLGIVGESFEFSELLAQPGLILASPLLLPIMILIILGAITKSAQFPFHFWLPNAMEAPTPVSAYLHSATMVKAGIYLIARCTPLFSSVEFWQYTISIIGCLTMVTGAVMALAQTDLKRVLAYTTVSSLGVIVFLLGLGTEQTIVAACVYLLSHALFKGALFMTAGIIDHETGSRDVTQLSGLGRRMPVTAAIAILAGLSMAGIPPLMGFIAKELLYDAVLRNNFFPTLLIIVCVLANMALLAASVIIALRPFVGAKTSLPKAPHDPSVAFLAGPAVLASLGFIFGFFLEFPVKSLIQPMAVAVAGYRLPVDLYLWHGLNLPLFLSILTIAGGAYLFKERRHFRDSELLGRIFNVGPERAYNAAFNGLVWLAAFQTRKLQSGFMRNYLLTILAFTIALVGYTLFRAINFNTIIEAGFTPLYHEIALAVVVIIGVLAVVKMRSRLGAVAALGVVGYGAALFFVFFGAPDLAMTQFAIETLTVILFVFILYQLPGFTSFSSSLVRFRDVIVSAGFGILMTLIVLAVTVKPYDPRLSTFFAEYSYTLAKGRNVVNVILVDFRSLDTLGEIVVIAVAAIGVYALLKLRIKPADEK